MKYLLAACMLFYYSLPVSAQVSKVTLSGLIKDSRDHSGLPYVTVVVQQLKDSSFVAGTVSGDEGRFTLTELRGGRYLLKMSYSGYEVYQQELLVGTLSPYLDLGSTELTTATRDLGPVTITTKLETVSGRMDKKTFDLSDNISQTGSSVLEAMKNLPGVTLQDGKVQLRGSDKVMVLIDGKQTALTGFGGQSGLDNIPASAIARVELINNPAAKYDANGNAGIINIIYKKQQQLGFNGKLGFISGLGALWIKRNNYPGIQPQYQATPKLNPSLSLNYRKRKLNLFFQGDNLYTKTLNKNEFVQRIYDNGTITRQQTKRNRTTNTVNTKAGMDWFANEQNIVTISGLFSSEKIMDRGDEPFFNDDLSQRQRLWQFIEDELKTTVTGSAGWQHQFRQPGRSLQLGLNYTFHRENEQYFFTNILPAYTGLDSFKLLSDEQVVDLTADYVQPLKYGRIEGGLKFRRRYIPVNMRFIPGLNSPLDTNAGGWANYTETIPALYSNYVFENKAIELEAGLRVEYVAVDYQVNPDHNTYKSDGYNYMQPFPNLRLAHKFNDNNKISLLYNRRIDRPDEVDIRIFPKYDDAAIIKVGNPGLRPQFTNSFELGYKKNRSAGLLYVSLYHKRMDATITRIASVVPGSDIIYNIFANTGKSYMTGTEILLSYTAGKWAAFSANLNGYQHRIDAYTVVNLYPQVNTVSAAGQKTFSGNIKLNSVFHFPRQLYAQVTAIYLAPDIVPQGKTAGRFSIDMGLKQTMQKGKGELFLNATDIANSLRNKTTIQGNGFRYTRTDYYETQVVRLGYSYKF